MPSRFRKQVSKHHTSEIQHDDDSRTRQTKGRDKDVSSGKETDELINTAESRYTIASSAVHKQWKVTGKQDSSDADVTEGRERD